MVTMNEPGPEGLVTIPVMVTPRSCRRAGSVTIKTMVTIQSPSGPKRVTKNSGDTKHILEARLCHQIK